MKRFLKRLSFFIVLVSGGWLCLEIFYRTVPSNYTVKHDNIESAEGTEVLILGNSHTLYGLNPEAFSSKTFNLANVSQTILLDELLFDKYLESLKELKYVIIPIEYSRLSQADAVPELEWRMYFYEEQMDLKTGQLSNFDLKKYSLALAPPFKITFNSLKEYYKQGTLADCGANGWATLEGLGPDNNPEMGKIIAYKHEDGSTNFENNTARLKRIIEKCEARDISVLLVTMPVTTYYANEVNRDKLAKIFKECEGLDASTDNAQYLNLFQDSRFSNSDFYDVDHLNTGGAKKCSKIIDDYIATLPQNSTSQGTYLPR